MHGTAEPQVKRVLMVAEALPDLASNVNGTPAHIAKSAAALRRRGLDVRVLEIDWRHTGHWNKSHYYSTVASAPWRIPDLLRSIRPDVVHCHAFQSASLMLPATRALAVPLLCEVHGMHPNGAASATLARRVLSRAWGELEAPVHRGADLLLCQAWSMARHLIATHGVSPSRVAVIYPGLVTSEFSQHVGRRESIDGVPDDEFVVMYVGATQHFQGLGLLAAAQRFCLARGARFRTVLIVSGEARDGDENVVAKFGFCPRSTVVDRPSSNRGLPLTIQRADVLVHARPKCIDNVNVQSKLGLYLASGKPIVTTDLGDYPRILGSNKGFILAKPTAEDFGHALMKAISDKNLAERARTHGPALAAALFDMDANVRRLIALYGSLAQSSRGVA